MMDAGTLGLVVTLVVLAGIFSAVDAALAGFSKARADELHDEQRAGAGRLMRILEDPARYLNTVILLRLLCEIGATVLFTLWFARYFDGAFWPTVGATIATMALASFVVIGVAPRTLGRQHATSVALISAGPLSLLTGILGPVPKLLILLGNAITPGRGFRDGPFQTETELRELVDLAEATAVIESGERKMIHSVFELGDTVVREVMVPRGDVVWIERYKNLRQAMSLFLRSGYSRIPVIGENLDEVLGMLYLKDVVKRDFDEPDIQTVLQVEQLMRPVHYVPESKPADELLTELQTINQHVAMVVDEYGGVAGLVTIEDVLEEIVGEITDEYDNEVTEVEWTEDGTARVSSRYPVDDLDELFGIDIDDEDIDSVGGLMAKELGVVPIPGSVVVAHGLRFEAEQTSGRRNKLGTVLITKVASVDPETRELP